MPTLKRPARFQRNRRGRTKNNRTLSLSLVADSIDFATPTVTATFPVPVVLKGIPQWLSNTGKLPVSATMTSPTVVAMTYDAPGLLTTVTVPENDPAIRSATGGFCAPGTFPAT